MALTGEVRRPREDELHRPLSATEEPVRLRVQPAVARVDALAGPGDPGSQTRPGDRCTTVDRVINSWSDRDLPSDARQYHARLDHTAHRHQLSEGVDAKVIEEG